MRFQDLGMLKIAVMYLSIPQRAATSMPPPSRTPAHEGMTLRSGSTQGVITSRRSGMALSQAAFRKTELPPRAMLVKVPKKSSRG